MPYLSSDLCNQMSLYDPLLYISGVNKVLYPEDVSEEIFHGSDSSNIEKEEFDLESGEASDYHFIGDEQATSKIDYFNCFWGENWFFSLKNSSNRSYTGEMEKLETPHPDEELAIWQSYNYNRENVEMSNNLKYGSPCEDGLKNTSLWKNCNECFDDVHSRNDELYGYIADEGLSEWLLGNGKDAQKLEADELSPGYGEAAVAAKLASQDP